MSSAGTSMWPSTKAIRAKRASLRPVQSGISNASMAPLARSGKCSLGEDFVRLTAFTDFGLRALMRLAGSPERSFTVPEIAEELAISRDHLMKVEREVARHGFITTQRGAAGGIHLAKPASEIRL